MTEAKIAYRLAEERIAKVKAEGLRSLSLSPHRVRTFETVWHSDSMLDALETLPPSLFELVHLRSIALSGTEVSDIGLLANLTELTVLELDRTPVADFTPLANLIALREIQLNETLIIDLSPLA